MEIIALQVSNKLFNFSGVSTTEVMKKPLVHC